MAATGALEYRRLRPETSDQSTDGNSITGKKQDDSPPLPHRVHLPTKAPTIRYVPHSSWSRYKAAMQSLVPFRRSRRSAQSLPVDRVGLFSYVTFSWLRNTVGKMDESSMPACSPLDSCDINGQRLHHIWREEGVHSGQLGSSLFVVMWRFVRTRVLVAALIYFLGLAFSILGLVFFLTNFLDALKNTGPTSDYNSTANSTAKVMNEAYNSTPNGTAKVMNEAYNSTPNGTAKGMNGAYVWAASLIVTELVSALLVSWSWSIVYRTATRLRSASMALVYNKLVRLSNLSTISTQQMVTLLGTDGQKLYEAVLYGPYLITAPIVFLFCLISCTYILKGSFFDVLIAMTVFVVTNPLMYVLVRLTSHLTAQTTALCTRRLALVYEMLVYIRLVKMSTWENVLSQRLTKVRRKELSFTRHQHFCDGFCTSTIQIIPVVALVLFLCSKADADLKASEVFPVLALFFGHMKDSLFRFWLGMKKVSDVFPSLERYKSIMLLNEVNKFIERPINRLMAVNISNANFVWDNVQVQPKNQKNEKQPKRRPLSTAIEMDQLSAEVEPQAEPTLVDITFLAPKGKLIGICGGPKCGKTSLLLTVLGHLHHTCGQVLRDGNCAYVGQRPWIWTANVRDNIVFKEPFHHKRYYSALHSCSLNEDVDQLPHHDDTQIDEMGLSAGQKQRIALARALYSNRDIYLLDNPLSMVDADMAATVFDKCILKALRGQTVILVTRHVQFMTRCDEVYLMEKGKIIGLGTHEQLMQQCPPYSSLIKTYTHENAKKYFVETSRRHESVSSMTVFLHQNIRRADSVTSIGSSEVDGKDVHHLDKVDFDSTGPIGVYIAYLGSLCSYVWIVSGLLSQLVYNACLFGIPLSMLHLHFQSQWTDLTSILNITVLILMLVGGMVWSLSFTKIVVGVSQRAHDLWFEKLCRAPMGYFQASPAMMCVLNLFSLNVQEIDMRLPLSLRMLLENTSFFLCANFVLVYISPYSLAVMLLALLFSAVFLGLPYRKSLLKIHETEVASRVPLYQHLVTTITGRTTIQAFSKDKDFVADFTRKCDDNATCTYLLSATSCWLAVRVQAITAMAVGLVAVVLINVQPVQWSENLSTDWAAGFVLVIVMQIGGCLQCILQSMAESEASLKMFAESSRCIQGIQSESQIIKIKHKLLPANWPTDGSIVFEHVETLVSSGSSHALNGMSFQIETGQKIGVVGLPGSGKRLLVDALFRLVEVKQGKILIGGTDLAYVPLEKLRSSLAIVPQDPVLFAGTIRLNIDPHKTYHDLDVWKSLQKVNLRECIERLPRKLDTPVDRNGYKLSVRDRQLLCLARACLRDTKVLILEEPLATAGDDLDAELNHVAWNLFPSATVITIAHQMKYVVRCDKVMVVEGGKVEEFDTPTNLYRDQQSRFSRMISASMGNLFETEL